MGRKLIVFGGSGHAKDLILAARNNGYDTFLIVTTDGASSIESIATLKEADFAVENYPDWHGAVAIGNNSHRKRFFEQYNKLHFPAIISKSAVIADTAKIKDGCYIGAFAYIGPDANIANACIINTHSIVGHDSKVEHYSHIGPHVCISGHVEIGRNVFVGAGTIFNNGSKQNPLKVADDVTIGMSCQITASIKQAGAKLIPKPNYISIRD